MRVPVIIAAAALTVGLLGGAPATAQDEAPTPSPDAQITFLAELPHRAAALERAAQQISSPGNPQFREHLTLRQAAQRFGATDAQIRRLRATAQSLGLSAAIDPTRLIVRLTGPVSAWEAVMGSSITYVPSQPGNPYNSFLFPSQEVMVPTIGDPKLWEAYYLAEGFGLLDVPAALSSVVNKLAPAYNEYVPADDKPAEQQTSGTIEPRTLFFPGSGQQPVPTNPAASRIQSCVNEPGAPLASSGLFGGPLTPDAMLGHDQVFAAYGLDRLQRTVGEDTSGRVAILSWGGGFSESDLALAASCFGFTKPDVNIALGTGMPAPFANVDGEATLDVQTVSSTLSRAKAIHVVQVVEGVGSGGWSLVDGYTRALALQPKPHAITTSYGLCEPMWANRGMFTTIEPVFQFASVIGTTITVSAGDTGSSTCQVNFGESLQLALELQAAIPQALQEAQGNPAEIAFIEAQALEIEQTIAQLTPAAAFPRVTVAYPASSPYATAVGGTQMYLNPDGTRAVEVVWNDLPYAQGNLSNLVGTGGSSSAFDAPWYQRPLVPSAVRSVPDIAAIAGGAPALPIVQDGIIQPTGGTSQASPMMAAGLAMVSTREVRAGRAPLGFANPWLYDMVRKHPKTVYDVTEGTNQYAVPYSDTGTNIPACCQAGPGYDQTTGLGALQFDQVIRHTR